jgi:hypothetical protein
MSNKIDLEIKVPLNWSAVPLRKYLDLIKDMETYKDTPEAIDAALLYHLCDVQPHHINKLDISIYTDIREKLYKLMAIKDAPLKRKIKIDNKKYGFEPNLGEMEYGAYLDLMKYKEVKIDENWAEMMSILYRPIKSEVGALYEINTYDGKLDKEKFLDVTMDVHFGAMFFFLNISTDLLNSTRNSLKKELLKEVHNLNTTLTKNGLDTQRFTSLVEETS